MLMCLMVFVNGARGEVVCIATNSDIKVTHVVVKFDNAAVGAKVRHASNFLSYPDAVPLVRHEQFLLPGVNEAQK